MPADIPIRAEQYLSPDTLAQLAPFELRAKMVVEGVRSGPHRSPYSGTAVEFAEHRQYAPGDELRHLDWKVFGRTDKLYVKQHRLETNLDTVLLVDSSASMAYGSLPVKRGWGGTRPGRAGLRWTKFDHAAALAVALAYLCLRQRDRVGLILFADEVSRVIPRASAAHQWRRIVSALSTCPVQAPTNLAAAVRRAAREIPNRALFIILSDLFDDSAAVCRALSRLRYLRHDVILLNILDRREMRFDLAGPAAFEGMEGEGRLRVDPAALRDAYLASLHAHLDAIAAAARSLAFDYCRVDTHDSVAPPLAHVLAQRSAFLRRRKLA